MHELQVTQRYVRSGTVRKKISYIVNKNKNKTKRIEK